MKIKHHVKEKKQTKLNNKQKEDKGVDLIDQQIELFAEILIDQILNEIYEQERNNDYTT